MLIKLEWLGHHYGEKNYDDMLNRFYRAMHMHMRGIWHSSIGYGSCSPAAVDALSVTILLKYWNVLFIICRPIVTDKTWEFAISVQIACLLNRIIKI